MSLMMIFVLVLILVFRSTLLNNRRFSSKPILFSLITRNICLPKLKISYLISGSSSQSTFYMESYFTSAPTRRYLCRKNRFYREWKILILKKKNKKKRRILVTAYCICASSSKISCPKTHHQQHHYHSLGCLADSMNG